MKLIGKRVCLIDATKEHPRSGEGDFTRLPDGRIMYAYSDYYTEGASDHAPSQISAVFSSDEGESFGGYRVLIPPSDGIVNRMCVSFLSMQNGEIGMFYGEKYKNTDGRIFMRLMLTRTKDGETFSEPKSCAEGIEYSVFENARVIRLSSGRILIPSNDHPYGEDGNITLRGVFELFYSDDDAETFKKAPFRIENPLKTVPSGLQETGVCEIEDGFLTRVTERTKIRREGDHAIFCEGDAYTALPLDATVSMNCWGFTPDVFEKIERGFEKFLSLESNDPKREYYLPFSIMEILDDGACSVRVYSSQDAWYGVTYREDHDAVASALKHLKDTGIYPQKLNETENER
jgi:hypothetical protein